MDAIINAGIPHILKQIFESTKTVDLIQCLEVSQTWQILAKNVLHKRWRGKMFLACKTGQFEIVKLLSENWGESGLCVTDRLGRTPLMKSCQYGFVDIVQVLIDHSNDLNSLNCSDYIACIFGADRYGTTPLMVACRYGHDKIVKVLLEQ